MRNSNYESGHQFVVSFENPQMFSPIDIKRFIELDTQFHRNKQEDAEWIRLRRSFARTVGCSDCKAEADETTLIITLF